MLEEGKDHAGVVSLVDLVLVTMVFGFRRNSILLLNRLTDKSKQFIFHLCHVFSVTQVSSTHLVLLDVDADAFCQEKSFIFV